MPLALRPAESRSSWVAMAAIVLAAASFRIALVHHGALPKDDAYITFRYAENLAAGAGFVYNAGERVLGVTTPLYVLLIAALARLGFDTAGASVALGILATCALGILLWRFGRALGLGRLAFLAPALMAVHPNAVHCDLSGMEAPLYALGVVGVLYAAHRDRGLLVAILLGLLCLLRPEGALLAGLWVIARLGARKPITRAEGAIFAAIVLPWLVFAFAYFGSPIPNSIPAKLALYRTYDVGSAAERLQTLCGLRTIAGWALFVVALAGIGATIRRWPAVKLGAAYLALTLAALASSHVLLFFWYEAPLTPLLLLFFGAGLAAIQRPLRMRWGMRRSYQAAQVLVLLIGSGAAGIQAVRAAAFERDEARALMKQHLRAARWLAARASPSDVVLADDIGYVGYAFRGRIIDRSGLVSPEVIPYNAAGRQQAFVERVLDRHPRHWLFIALDAPESREVVRSALLDESYEQVLDLDRSGPDDFGLYRAVGGAGRVAPASARTPGPAEPGGADSLQSLQQSFDRPFNDHGARALPISTPIRATGRLQAPIRLEVPALDNPLKELTMRMRHFALGLGAAGLCLIATGLHAEMDFNSPPLGDPYANAPAYVRPVAPNVEAWPIVTTGQQIAGSGPGNFRFLGIPDGMGLYHLNGGPTAGQLSLLVNHEFNQNQGGPAGPLPSGARASELTLRYRPHLGQTRVSALKGEWVTERVYVGDTPALLDPVPAGFARLCSAYLGTDREGFDQPIFFHGEESEAPATFDGNGGLCFATFEGGTWALPRMGRAAWENLVAAPFTGTKTVLFPLEDGPSLGDGLNSQFYMYVGEKVPGASNPLTVNGLNNGKVYTFVSADPTRTSEATFTVKGSTVSGHWEEVSWYLNDSYFDTATRARGAFGFIRIEDGAPDPESPGVLYFVTTGKPSSANNFGRLYRLNFDATNPVTGPASLTLLLDGSEGIVSPDNIDLNAHGELMICEDPNYNLATDLGLTRDSSLWAYLVPTGELVRVAEMDRPAARAHALAADPGNSSVASSDTPGGWETSGIIDAEAWLGRGSWILNVQAHSLRIVPIAETVQGGQVMHLKWLPSDFGVLPGSESKDSGGAGERGAAAGAKGAALGAPAGAPSAAFVLSAAPNPFADRIAIRFGLAREDEVKAVIYDATGRLVRTLVAGRLPAGERVLDWDGRDSTGNQLSNGVYFVEATATALGATERAKLILTR